MTILCKDCQWWTLRLGWMDEDDNDPQFPGEKHKYCTSPKAIKNKMSTGDDGASISSYESIGTGPNFGCIHAEVKL